MNKLIVVDPEGEPYIKEIDDSFEHVDALKEFLDEKNISYNEEINNGHKLCLDLSREGYWIFRASEHASIMYIGKEITNKQFDWYSYNSYNIDQMNIISIASWYDTDYEVGYDVIEQGSVGFNTFDQRRERISDLVIDKNKDYEKSHRNRKFRFFGRAK